MNKYDKILKIYEHGILEKSCPEGQQWCPVKKECVPMGQGKGKVAEGDEKSSDEYQAFFKKMLKKFGVTEPDKLPDDKKKEFYDAVDKGWKGKDEKPEANEAKLGPFKQVLSIDPGKSAQMIEAGAAAEVKNLGKDKIKIEVTLKAKK